jgi:hypothetical protein
MIRLMRRRRRRLRMNLTRIIECHGEVWVVKFGFGGQGEGEKEH